MEWRTTGPTAAISGILPGIQAQGLWAGRRQLFVRFAGEAETATLFTPDMLIRHVERGSSQGGLHSVSLSGRDPLGSADLLQAVFKDWKPELPVMADTDGQRPEAIIALAGVLALVQVTLDLSEPGGAVDRAMSMVSAAAAAGCAHAVVLAPRDGTTDGQLLRLIEQTHAVSPGTKIVVHPPGAGSAPPDRRYAALMERAMAIHHDLRLAMRIPPPLGMR
ncbi:MAG: hypothetical protein ACREON_11195 [Gemmatimonadaceae bacterium]